MIWCSAVQCSLSISSVLPDTFWESNAFETDTDLPSGWMRVRDTSGTYYWHIPTGTTQWEPPSAQDKLGDCVMSSSMSLETTPCEEQEVGDGGRGTDTPTHPHTHTLTHIFYGSMFSKVYHIRCCHVS